MMKNLLVLVILSFFTLSLSAQTVTGTVTDGETGDVLFGVNVVPLEDPSTGTTTDFDGKYSLELQPEWTTLVFTYIGFDKQEIPIEGRSVIDVKMGSGSFNLDQVVISASKKREKLLNAPASISVITAERIQNQTSLTAIDNLKKTPGVDIMQTGLVSANVNVRGFNGVFNGQMLTMVDNRIGSVPSLRVNAFQLIPGNAYDYDKIEVLRGPASALYGPNSAEGVMHIITKSPIDIEGKQETTVSITGGIRNVIIDPPAGAVFEKGDIRTVIKPEFRTAIKLSDKFGFKISGKYMSGPDWEYYDPREPAIGSWMQFGNVSNGTVWTQDPSIPARPYDRIFDIENYNGDFRADYRPTKDSEIIVSAGLSSTENLELTGLGAAQSVQWNYSYAQSRFRYKNLFFQYFLNSSNAGDRTYLIPFSQADTIQAQLLVDKSKLHVFQLQNSNEFLERDRFKIIYGLDALLTRPNTEGSINGRFENDDNVNQYGAYIQGEYEFTPKWKAVAAVREDYHDRIDEFQFSPRAALIYKPDPKHTLRATYNKAFTTPSNFSLSLDLANGIHPLWNGVQNDIYNPVGTEMNIRGIGNPVGYNYHYDDGGALAYHNFWDGNFYNLTDNTQNNHVYFDQMVGVLADQLAGQVEPGLAALVPAILQLLFADITGEGGSINGAGLSGLDFVDYLGTGDANASLWDGDGDLSNLLDFGPQKSETVETYELGYKGILKDKLYLQVDAYYTQKKNLRSGLQAKSPLIIFNPNDFIEALGTNEPGQLLHDNLAETENLIYNLADGGSLAALLENNPDFVVDANGDAYDELFKLLTDLNAQVGLGVVTPDDDKVNDDIILTYINQGDVEIFGADMGFTYVFSDDIQLQGAYSWVNDTELLSSFGDTVFFNAPKNKFSLGLDHMLGDSGVGYGINFRWNQGFRANSTPYDGVVDPYNVLDAKVFYRPKFLDGFQVTLDVNNVIGTPYRTFPGTPEMGRMSFVKMAYTVK